PWTRGRGCGWRRSARSRCAASRCRPSCSSSARRRTRAVAGGMSGSGTAAGPDLLARVEAAGLLAPPGAVLVMLSGGRDSVCMLDLAVRARGAAAVGALHVDYGLRPESHDDADFCASLCRDLGV